MKRASLTLSAILLILACILLFTTKASDPIQGTFFGYWRTRVFFSTIILVMASLALLLKSISQRLTGMYLIVIFQIFVAVVVLEALGQFGIVDYQSLIGSNRIQTNDLGSKATPYVDESGETYQDIATLNGINHPPIQYHYKTDRRGFRNPTDPDEADVYLLGDSIVVGATVPFEKTVAGILGQNQSREFLNVALIGLGVQEQHALIRDTKLPLKNKMVIQFIFEGNDLRDSRHFREQQHQTENVSGWKDTLTRKSFVNPLIVLVQKKTYSLISKERAISNKCTIKDNSYEFLWLSNSFSGYENEQENIFNALKKFADYVKSEGGDLSLVFVPSKLRVLHEHCTWTEHEGFHPADHLGPLRESLILWAKKANIEALDLTPSLSDQAKTGEVPWYWGDTHWNEIGHEIAAEEIKVWADF